MSYDDNVVRKSRVEVTVDDWAKDFDTDTADRFRTYKGKYPREGYEPGDDPFRIPKVERKPPPLRG